VFSSHGDLSIDGGKAVPCEVSGLVGSKDDVSKVSFVQMSRLYFRAKFGSAKFVKDDTDYSVAPYNGVTIAPDDNDVRPITSNKQWVLDGKITQKNPLFGGEGGIKEIGDGNSICYSIDRSTMVQHAQWEANKKGWNCIAVEQIIVYMIFQKKIVGETHFDISCTNPSGNPPGVPEPHVHNAWGSPHTQDYKTLIDLIKKDYPNQDVLNLANPIEGINIK
jgi:hypothetical protein